MAKYSRRLIDDLLDELVPELPAIALEGARGVGKTATFLQRARTSYHLDDPHIHELFVASPQRFVASPPPVLVDEWQLMPDTWNYIRRAVDDGAPGGSFLLTGSVSIPPEARIHSGAGRIASLKLRPLSMAERAIAKPTVSLSELLDGGKPDIGGESDCDIEQYAHEIVASGFPGLRGKSARARAIELDSYLDRSTNRQIAANRADRNSHALASWLRAYGAASASTASYESILNAATAGEHDKPSRTTVASFREHLHSLYLLDPLPSWTASFTPLKRLAAAPKHHLVDPALAARLNGASEAKLLAGEAGRISYPGARTFLASLFESLVVQSVRVYADLADADSSHLRTRNGTHEIDIIVERRDGAVLPIEVKLAQTPSDSDAAHLNWLEKQIPDRVADKLIVTTGAYAYRRQDGTAVVPLALLGP